MIDMYDIMSIVDLIILLIGFYMLIRTCFYYIILKHFANLCFGFIVVILLGIIGQIHAIFLHNHGQWLFKFFAFGIGILTINFSKDIRIGKK